MRPTLINFFKESKMPTPTTKQIISAMYVAGFNRAPDQGGLTFWESSFTVNSAAAIKELSAGFASHPVFTQLYPSTMSNLAFVQAIYTNVLGSAGDAGGILFWNNALNAGLSRSDFLGAFVESALTIDLGKALAAGQLTQAEYDAATIRQQWLYNKSDVGLDYANTLGDASNLSPTTDTSTIAGLNADPAYQASIAVLGGVDNTNASVIAALTLINSAAASTDPVAYINDNAQTGTVGQNFDLTVNQDSGPSFTGTSVNDTFTAAAAQDGAGNLINTLQNVDAIDGAAGTDTLNVTLSQVSTVSATIKNIENVNVRFANAAAILDLANATGATTLTVGASTTKGQVDNIGSIASIAIRNQNQDVNIGGKAGSATTLALNLDTVGTKAAPITLDLGVANASKAETANITANNAYVKVDSTKADVFKAATITATGTNAINLADSATTLETLIVKGAGSVDLSASKLAALTKLDGSASTGAIKAEITTVGKAVTITTGSGADNIDADAVATAGSSATLGAGNDTLYVGANLAAFDKGANGGDGTDIINITTGASLTSTTAKYITNIETLDVSGGAGAYDVSLNSFATVQIGEAINGVLAGAVTFKDASDSFTLNILSKAETNADFNVANNTTVALKDAAGTTAKGDAETFTLVATINDGNKDNTADGNINAQTINVAGVENLVVKASVGTLDGGTDAKVAAEHTLTAKLVDAQAETLTVSGDASVDLSGLTTLGVVSKIDASGSTGNVKIDMSTHATSIAYTGSAGVDTYTASTKGDTLYTAKGADVATFTAAVRDTFVLKTATDSQITDTSKNGELTIGADSGWDNVKGFDTAAGATGDRIDLTNFGFSGSQRGVVDVSGSVNATTNLTNIADLFNSPAGDRGVASSTFGGSTYVFVDANKDGNFTAADDLLIQLTGVASISENNINF
jgi:hypothetical protein